MRQVVCIAALLTGLFTPFTVSVGGAMPLGELVLLAVAGWLTVLAALEHRLPGELLGSPLLKFLMICQAVAFFGYMMSDFYRGSATGDMMRGWSRMVFLGIDICVVAFLFGEATESLYYLQLGAAAASSALAVAGDVQFGDYWKFGFGGPVTLLVFMLSPRLGFWLSQAALVALGGLHFVMDFRSAAGTCLLAASLLFAQRIPRQIRALALPLLLVAAAGGIVWFYGRSDDSSADRKERSNVERGAMMTAAYQGFISSPFIGQGSWFSKSNVMDNFLAIRQEEARLSGVGGYSADDDEGIAVHSQILVGLAEGGIVGGMFFIAYGACLLWAIYYVSIGRTWDQRGPLYLLILSQAVWNLGFSPFSGAHRINIAVAVGVLLLLAKERRQTAARAVPETDDWRRGRALRTA